MGWGSNEIGDDLSLHRYKKSLASSITIPIPNLDLKWAPQVQALTSSNFQPYILIKFI